MKSNKFIILFVIISFLSSCGVSYRVVTTIDNGSAIEREVYAQADSAFLAGNRAANPFLFESEGWEVLPLDSLFSYDMFGNQVKLNVKAFKKVSDLSLLSKELISKEGYHSFTSPSESLTKKFRWFYTDHTYTAVFEKMQYELPIPVTNYLTEEEQRLWTQGDFRPYLTWNGIEMYNHLSGLDERFFDWYQRNYLEICLDLIASMSDNRRIISPADRESLYKVLSKKGEAGDLSPELICRLLDEKYQTKDYSGLYKQQGVEIDNKLEEATSIVDRVSCELAYELVFPGTLVYADATFLDANRIVWKVDGLRLLFADYTLTATYRTCNPWAFVLTGLFVLVALVSMVVLKKIVRGKFK